MAILTAATSLLDIFAFTISRFANGFFIRHLRSTHISLHSELTFHTINNDFQVQFTHTSNDHLTSFFVTFYAEGRIFFTQLL